MPAPIGNQNAAKAKRWQKALERALARKFGDVDDGLTEIAAHVVNAAERGDKDAWAEIGNRIDGKPAQAITGEDGGAVKFEVIAPWMATSAAERNG